RDRRNMAEVAPLERALEQRLSTHRHGAEPANLTEAGRMIEEYRISLFAQPLGAVGNPSPKRIKALLDA
ncbi:MAG: DUF3418 domain-containing protein, partial [Actinomycetota bacterium]|nr:DUF3418 domain-containing protein [Actinomycetota bacterium]